MSYLSPFERSFCEHTLTILDEYQGQYEVTNLVNCLLGLLVVPKESMLNSIPDESLETLENNWGLRRSSITCAGRVEKDKPMPDSLRGLVYNLRNSVAHFLIKPEPATENVTALKFGPNKNGFSAEIPIEQLDKFVKKLSSHLLQS